jgi:hypothetical protein
VWVLNVSDESAPDLCCLGVDPDEAHVDAQAAALGRDVVELWQAVRDAASQEAGRARL